MATSKQTPKLLTLRVTEEELKLLQAGVGRSMQFTRKGREAAGSEDEKAFYVGVYRKLVDLGEKLAAVSPEGERGMCPNCGEVPPSCDGCGECQGCCSCGEEEG
jgi:hypothetical protein